MIRDDETDHPDMKAAAADLSQLVGRLRAHHGNQMSARLLQETAELIRDHRTHCRQQGIDFPVMCMLVVPRLNILELKRRDADLKSIRQTMINFVGEHPEVTAQDAAIAAMGAWQIKPGDLVDEGVAVRERRQRRDAIVAAEMAAEPEEGTKH